MKTTDVLIVGAGPSGSACGISLQKANVDCILIDKATFPRVKLCGGLFTKKGQDCLHDFLDNDAWEACMKESVMGREKNFALWDKHKLVVKVPLDNEVVLIDRPSFDNFLVQHYKHLGGKMLEGNGLKAIDFAAHKATLESGEEIEYKHLVAADGANSMVGHLLAKADKGYKFSKKGCFCLEMNIDKEDYESEDVNIHFNIVPDSYAWVFRKGSKSCIGVCNASSMKIDLREALIGFMQKIGVKNIDKYPVRGAMIPAEVRPSEWKTANILFAGDAGGFAELLTYEGIYYALRSGNYAAQSIINERLGKSASYSKMVKPIYNKMKHGRFFQSFFYWEPFFNLFIKYGCNHGRFIKKFYADNIDNIPSQALWKQIAVIIFKTTRTLIRKK